MSVSIPLLAAVPSLTLALFFFSLTGLTDRAGEGFLLEDSVDWRRVFRLPFEVVSSWLLMVREGPATGSSGGGKASDRLGGGETRRLYVG